MNSNLGPWEALPENRRHAGKWDTVPGTYNRAARRKLDKAISRQAGGTTTKRKKHRK